MNNSGQVSREEQLALARELQMTYMSSGSHRGENTGSRRSDDRSGPRGSARGATRGGPVSRLESQRPLPPPPPTTARQAPKSRQTKANNNFLSAAAAQGGGVAPQLQRPKTLGTPTANLLGTTPGEHNLTSQPQTKMHFNPVSAPVPAQTPSRGNATAARPQVPSCGPFEVPSPAYSCEDFMNPPSQVPGTRDQIPSPAPSQENIEDDLPHVLDLLSQTASVTSSPAQEFSRKSAKKKKKSKEARMMANEEIDKAKSFFRSSSPTETGEIIYYQDVKNEAKGNEVIDDDLVELFTGDDWKKPQKENQKNGPKGNEKIDLKGNEVKNVVKGIKEKAKTGPVVAEKATSGFGITQKPVNDFGVPEKTKNGLGITEKPMSGFGITQKPTNDFGMAEKAKIGFGVTENVKGSCNAEKTNGPGITPKATNSFGITDKIIGFDITKGINGPSIIEIAKNGGGNAEKADGLGITQKIVGFSITDEEINGPGIIDKTNETHKSSLAAIQPSSRSLSPAAKPFVPNQPKEITRVSKNRKPIEIKKPKEEGAPVVDKIKPEDKKEPEDNWKPVITYYQ